MDIEAYKFYDRAHRLYDAALLTRCYTQHALRPYIDSEINHIRHFIEIQFPIILKDKSVISSIHTYFENKESPIICYKYNKPVRTTVFNYNKLVTELDIETTIPDSRGCKDSKYCYQPAGHAVSGDLKIITDSRIRFIICKGT